MAAICGGTAVLARVGLLNEVPHTSNAPEFLEMTSYTGIKYYVSVPAITAGNLITASGVAPVAFAAEIFRKLGLYSDATLEVWWLLSEHQKLDGFYKLIQGTSKGKL